MKSKHPAGKCWCLDPTCVLWRTGTGAVVKVTNRRASVLARATLWYTWVLNGIVTARSGESPRTETCGSPTDWSTDASGTANTRLVFTMVSHFKETRQVYIKPASVSHRKIYYRCCNCNWGLPIPTSLLLSVADITGLGAPTIELRREAGAYEYNPGMLSRRLLLFPCNLDRGCNSGRPLSAGLYGGGRVDRAPTQSGCNVHSCTSLQR